jgi:hypothetical protein
MHEHPHAYAYAFHGLTASSLHHIMASPVDIAHLVVFLAGGVKHVGEHFRRRPLHGAAPLRCRRSVCGQTEVGYFGHHVLVHENIPADSNACTVGAAACIQQPTCVHTRQHAYIHTLRDGSNHP